MTEIMKVLQQGEIQWVDSQKADGGKLAKCVIVLQELGGKYENQYVAVMLGNVAQQRFNCGDLVAVSLRFQAREYGNQVYQDIMVSEIAKI